MPEIKITLYIAGGPVNWCSFFGKTFGDVSKDIIFLPLEQQFLQASNWSLGKDHKCVQRADFIQRIF